MNRLNIAYLDHTSKWSGGEIALYRTLSALDRSLVNPCVLAASDGEFVKRINEINIPVSIFNLDEALANISKDYVGIKVFRNIKIPISYVRYSMRIAKYIRDQKIHIVHCNSLKSDIYGLIAARTVNRKIIWHIRDHISEPYLSRNISKIFGIMARTYVSGVITNSKSTYDTIFNGENNKIQSRIIYDGLLGHELAMPMLDRSDMRIGRCKIGILGRITYWKGQHVAIEAVKNLINECYDVELKIIGSPMFGEYKYEKELFNLARPIRQYVDFTGFKSDIFEMLKKLDVLIHCSILPEPFGQVIIEGMAQGLPVIASDAGGAREIIESEVNGVLTPVEDVNSLTGALIRLINDPDFAYRIASGGYKTVREKFTAEKSARAIEAFYEEVLSKR